MADSPREELCEIARLVGAHLEWQRELGATGFARPRSGPPPVESVTDVAGPAPRASTPPAEPPGAPAAAPAPAPTGAPAAPTPRFEMPAFLRKRSPTAGSDTPRSPPVPPVPPPSSS